MKNITTTYAVMEVDTGQFMCRIQKTGKRSLCYWGKDHIVFYASVQNARKGIGTSMLRHSHAVIIECDVLYKSTHQTNPYPHKDGARAYTKQQRRPSDIQDSTDITTDDVRPLRMQDAART